MRFARPLAAFLGRQRDGVRFCVLFAALTVLAFALLYALQATLIVRLNAHLAWVSGLLLRVAGIGALSSGPVVTVAGFGVEIRNNCNAIYEVGLYSAAIWSYPAPWRDRVIGTAVGAALLYVVNLVRIVTLVVVGLWQPSWFEMTHLYAWQALFLLVVTTCWLAWVSRVRSIA